METQAERNAKAYPIPKYEYDPALKGKADYLGHFGEFITYKQAASIAQVAYMTVAAWVAKDKFVTLKLGKGRVILTDSFFNFLEERAKCQGMPLETYFKAMAFLKEEKAKEVE